MRGTVSLRDLYAKYHKQVQFLTVYISEAHPVDGWWYGKGILKYVMKFYSPNVSMNTYNHKTMDERREVAGECEDALQYGIRTYVDELDDAVSKAYAAHPTRLYLVDIDGIVAYAAGLGPFDFHPHKLDKAIENYLA